MPMPEHALTCPVSKAYDAGLNPDLFHCTCGYPSVSVKKDDKFVEGRDTSYMFSGPSHVIIPIMKSYPELWKRIKEEIFKDAITYTPHKDHR